MKVLQAKYGCVASFIPRITSMKQGSNTQKNIKKAQPLVEQDLSWNIGKDNIIKFQKDHWVSSLDLLENYLLTNLSEIDHNKPIKDYVTPLGDQDWYQNLLKVILPWHICQCITIVLVPKFCKTEMIQLGGSLIKMVW